MLNKLRGFSLALLAGLLGVIGGMGFVPDAMAQIDVSSGVDALGDVVTAATAIGGAVIAAAAAYIAFRWVKGYLKGA